MNSIFETHTMTVKQNIIDRINRTPVNTMSVIASNIPCRLGTKYKSIRLYVLAKYYNNIPGGLHKNYRVSFNDYIQEYTIVREPIWAGGLKHHIECDLEESN